MPKRYRTQIAEEKWGDVVETINTFIKSQLQLPMEISIPISEVGEVLAAIFSNITLSSVDDQFLQIKGLAV